MSFFKLFSLLSLSILLSLGFSAPAAAKAVEGVVNINTATSAELTLLPGVGKAKAEQILQYRQAKPFVSIEDLKNIPGFGGKRLEAIRPHLTLEGATTAKSIATKPAAASAQPATPVQN